MTKSEDIGRIGMETQEPYFRVLATEGDRHLGGDDMDDLLAQYLESKLSATTRKELNTVKTSISLKQISKRIKEDLCGDGFEEPKDSVTTDIGDDTMTITYDEFDNLIQERIISRASSVVERALESAARSLKLKYDDGKNHTDNYEYAVNVDEVILVGGATRTPSIRTMLRSTKLFPKSPELCTSIHAEAAVAQGASINAAMKSGFIPKHVMKNALMLDALPHPIGVLIPSGDGNDTEEMYQPILHANSPLPSMGYATFELADIHQKGITIVAVEDVSEDLPLERIGEFTFLLHRLSADQVQNLPSSKGNRKRCVDVGMTVDTDGKFIVSILDYHDPEHVKKIQRYREWKNEQWKGSDDVDKVTIPVLSKDFGDGEHCSKQSIEEMILIISCIVLFGAYFAVRILFNDPILTSESS